MLQFEPELRPSIQEILGDDWLKNKKAFNVLNEFENRKAFVQQQNQIWIENEKIQNTSCTRRIMWHYKLIL